MNNFILAIEIIIGLFLSVWELCPLFVLIGSILFSVRYQYKFKKLTRIEKLIIVSKSIGLFALFCLSIKAYTKSSDFYYLKLIMLGVGLLILIISILITVNLKKKDKQTQVDNNTETYIDKDKKQLIISESFEDVYVQTFWTGIGLFFYMILAAIFEGI